MLKKQNITFTLLTFIIVSILFSLGCWQLRRAKEKQTLLDLLSSDTAVQNITTYPKNNDVIQQLLFKKIRILGYFINEHTIFLDNKVHAGKIGYEVFTPLITNDNLIILINRGWVQAPKLRKDFPVIPAIKELISIDGQLLKSTLNPFIKEPAESKTITWPLRVQNLDLNFISLAFNKPIYPLIIKLNATSAYAFSVIETSEWLTPEKHLGYALQWFALAVTLLIIFIKLTFFTKKT